MDCDSFKHVLLEATRVEEGNKNQELEFLTKKLAFLKKESMQTSIHSTEKHKALKKAIIDTIQKIGDL